MGILKILLKELIDKQYDLTSQIRTICDDITKEEKENFKHPELLPTGPRVFLSLEVPGRYDKEIGFLTLEREDEEKYIAVYFTLEKYKISEDIDKTPAPRRRKVWEINEYRAEKILTEFAMKLKLLRGD